LSNESRDTKRRRISSQRIPDPESGSDSLATSRRIQESLSGLFKSGSSILSRKLEIFSNAKGQQRSDQPGQSSSLQDRSPSLQSPSLQLQLPSRIAPGSTSLKRSSRLAESPDASATRAYPSASRPASPGILGAVGNPKVHEAERSRKSQRSCKSRRHLGDSRQSQGILRGRDFEGAAGAYKRFKMSWMGGWKRETDKFQLELGYGEKEKQREKDLPVETNGLDGTTSSAASDAGDESDGEDGPGAVARALLSKIREPMVSAERQCRFRIQIDWSAGDDEEQVALRLQSLVMVTLPPPHDHVVVGMHVEPRGEENQDSKAASAPETPPEEPSEESLKPGDERLRLQDPGKWTVRMNLRVHKQREPLHVLRLTRVAASSSSSYSGSDGLSMLAKLLDAKGVALHRADVAAAAASAIPTGTSGGISGGISGAAGGTVGSGGSPGLGRSAGSGGALVKSGSGDGSEKGGTAAGGKLQQQQQQSQAVSASSEQQQKQQQQQVLSTAAAESMLGYSDHWRSLKALSLSSCSLSRMSPYSQASTLSNYMYPSRALHILQSTNFIKHVYPADKVLDYCFLFLSLVVPHLPLPQPQVLPNVTMNLPLLEVLPNFTMNLPLLEVLEVENNRLSALPGEIGQLQQLRVLRADNNLLTTVPITLRECTNLRELSLENNRLVRPLLDFRCLADLRVLRLFNNPLEFFPEILPCRHLRLLSLANVRIVSDPDLKMVDVSIVQLEAQQGSYFSASKHCLSDFFALIFRYSSVHHPLLASALARICEDRENRTAIGKDESAIRQIVSMLLADSKHVVSYKGLWRMGLFVGNGLWGWVRMVANRVAIGKDESAIRQIVSMVLADSKHVVVS
ncbi:unnamed protein product, partial [Closterium sp. NIES-54]